MRTIAVLGASGVYARHLLPRLAGTGHAVRALVRRPEAAGLAAALGIGCRKADIFDAASLRAGLEGCDLCLNLATALPGPSGRGDFAQNDRLRREGVPVLLEACRDAGVGRLMQQGIAMVGGNDEALVEEPLSVAPEGDDRTAQAHRAALEMEASVKAAGLDWLILRGGFFYGPGTGTEEAWFAQAAAGKLRLPGLGADFVSLIHIADMAAAPVAAVGRWPSRQVLSVTDDEPARWREVLGHVAVLAGVPAPEPGGNPWFPSFRVSNRAARAALGWAPFYPDYRSGLAR